MGGQLVVITDSDLASNGVEETILSRAGLAVRRAACENDADVVAAAADADALIVQWVPITAGVLDELPNCRIISRVGIGVDMIDVDAATQRGVAVANTPDYCTEEVSVHALALILSCVRRILDLDRAVRSGRWDGPGDAPDARRPSLTTVAVIGFGRIGSRIAAGAAALGFPVVVHDPFVSDEEIIAAGHLPVGFDEALGCADVLTLHVPLNSLTRGLISVSAIDRMPPASLIVNTCRGGLIDEQALADALIAGRLGGAGLDVFEHEPLPADSPLRRAPNLLLTPHTAWYSRAALDELPVYAARQVVDFLSGRDVPSIVNPQYRRLDRARSRVMTQSARSRGSG